LATEWWQSDTPGVAGSGICHGSRRMRAGGFASQARIR
jgi:hypothetical protein